MRTRKRAPEEEEETPTDSFASLFTSLSIILLAFFILLKSMSANDEKKRRVALGSLFGTFGILPGGENIDSKGKHYSRLIPMTSKVSIFKGLSKEKELLESKGFVTGTDIEVERTADGVKITMKSPLLFTRGSDNIDPRAFVVMDRIGAIVMQIMNPIQIVGHVQRRNRVGVVLIEDWALSLSRAVSVANYLHQAVGVPPQMITAVGRGPHPFTEKQDNVVAPSNDTVVIYVKAAKVQQIEDPIPKHLLKKPVVIKRGE